MLELGISISAVFYVGIIFCTSVHDESKYETRSSLSGRELTEKTRQNFVISTEYWKINFGQKIHQFHDLRHVRRVHNYVGVRNYVGVHDYLGMCDYLSVCVTTQVGVTVCGRLDVLVNILFCLCLFVCICRCACACVNVNMLVLMRCSDSMVTCILRKLNQLGLYGARDLMPSSAPHATG